MILIKNNNFWARKITVLNTFFKTLLNLVFQRNLKFYKILHGKTYFQGAVKNCIWSVHLSACSSQHDIHTEAWQHKVSLQIHVNLQTKKNKNYPPIYFPHGEKSWHPREGQLYSFLNIYFESCWRELLK